MNCGPAGSEPINSYAVVAYIRGPLAEFLDSLRAELVTGCNSHAHVTILPPRPLAPNATPEQAETLIASRIPQFSSFAIEATGIRVFPITQVIYADIGKGTAELAEMHRVLNVDGLAFEEPFEFHPHLTLAQGLMPEEVPALVELAQRRWREFSHSRRFIVEKLTFVQNTVENKWLDLAEFDLPKVPSRTPAVR